MKILFIESVHPLLKENLESNGFVCDVEYNKSKKEIEKIISIYDGIIIRSKFKIDQVFIDQAKNLKFIARAGSGLENIDTVYASKKNIICYNAGEGNRQSVAEHAIGLLLSLLNKLNKCDQEVRNGIWKREENTGIELSGKTIGIIGYGNNGSALANIISNFGVKILAYDKYLNNHAHKCDMNTIYEQADILSLHIPLTEETKWLVNENYINKFKKNFYLINTSRGKCVKTSCLVTGLKNGKIKGVCLDVFEEEKIDFNSLNDNNNISYLLKSNKTILSPHVAGWTKESKIKIAKVLYTKIMAFRDKNL